MRKAGVPGTEMSGSVRDGVFLKGDGDTGALRGSVARRKGEVAYIDYIMDFVA